jgi:hypothetical protein
MANDDDSVAHPNGQASPSPPFLFEPKHYRPVRNHVLAANRERDGLPCLADDAIGERSLMVLLSLWLPDKDIQQHAPWVRDWPDGRLAALKREAAAFNPTPENIGRAIQYGVVQWNTCRTRNGRRRPIRPYDRTREEIDRMLADEKKAKRKEERQMISAEREAQCGPRELAIIAAIEWIAKQPFDGDYSMKNIRRVIARTGRRKAFPSDANSYRAASNNVFEHLVSKGAVRVFDLVGSGKRWAQVTRPTDQSEAIRFRGTLPEKSDPPPQVAVFSRKTPTGQGIGPSVKRSDFWHFARERDTRTNPPHGCHETTPSHDGQGSVAVIGVGPGCRPGIASPVWRLSWAPPKGFGMLPGYPDVRGIPRTTDAPAATSVDGVRGYAHARGRRP